MFTKLSEKLLSHNKITVFSHIRPDGDCIGAQVAVCLWLKKNGVDVSAVNEDTIPENFRWLAEYFPICKPEEVKLDEQDAFLVVDGNALHRFGKAAEKILSCNKPVYMIDHHPDPEPVFDEIVSDTRLSSTCEMIYNLYSEHNTDQIDKPAALAMYTGMMTDTGSFQFDIVTPETLKAASELLRKGDFTPNTVAEKVYATKKLPQLKLLSLALNTVSLYEAQQIAVMYVTKSMFEETNTSKEDTEGFVAYPLSLDGVKAAILFREQDGKVKMSLRSRSYIDVNKWARRLNGGGHKRAAGAWHPGPLEKAIEETVAIGREQLKQ